MVCVKTSLDFSNTDVAHMPAAILEVLGIAVHGFSVFNIYNPPNPLTSTSLDFFIQL